jgi:FkbM family methyltransferase
MRFGMKDKLLHQLTRSDIVRKTYDAAKRVPVLGAGARRMVRAVMPPGTKVWIQIPSGEARDFWMRVDPRFDLGYINGDHEPWIQTLLKSELRHGDCFYDVGAHTGFFSLVASRFVGKSGKMVAFEADPDIASVLEANFAKNAVTQALVVRAAVWSSPGQLEFEPASSSSNRTQGHIAEGNSDFPRISVPAIRLDDVVLCDGRPAPHLIKMDIEGAEWDALQGARRLFADIKPKLLCEVHKPSDLEPIRTFLEQFGYVVEKWEPVHRHYKDYCQLYLWATPRPVL